MLLRYSVVPDGFGYGVVIPLVKNTEGNHYATDNYRGITISPVISKIFLVATKHNFSLFDLDLCPTTLTYNLRLAKVKVDPHGKNQGQRSNGSNRKAPTDKRTDTHTCTHKDVTKRIYLPCYTVDKDLTTPQVCRYTTL